MDRPARFASHEWLGDKRVLVVHDVGACTAPETVQAMVESGTAQCFAPDTLAEARNRGYRRCRDCAGARSAAPAQRNA